MPIDILDDLKASSGPRDIFDDMGAPSAAPAPTPNYTPDAAMYPGEGEFQQQAARMSQFQPSADLPDWKKSDIQGKISRVQEQADAAMGLVNSGYGNLTQGRDYAGGYDPERDQRQFQAEMLPPSAAGTAIEKAVQSSLAAGERSSPDNSPEQVDANATEREKLRERIRFVTTPGNPTIGDPTTAFKNRPEGQAMLKRLGELEKPNMVSAGRKWAPWDAYRPMKLGDLLMLEKTYEDSEGAKLPTLPERMSRINQRLRDYPGIEDQGLDEQVLPGPDANTVYVQNGYARKLLDTFTDPNRSTYKEGMTADEIAAAQTAAGESPSVTHERGGVRFQGTSFPQSAVTPEEQRYYWKRNTDRTKVPSPALGILNLPAAEMQISGETKRAAGGLTQMAGDVVEALDPSTRTTWDGRNIQYRDQSIPTTPQKVAGAMRGAGENLAESGEKTIDFYRPSPSLEQGFAGTAYETAKSLPMMLASMGAGTVLPMVLEGMGNRYVSNLQRLKASGMSDRDARVSAFVDASSNAVADAAIMKMMPGFQNEAEAAAAKPLAQRLAQRMITGVAVMGGNNVVNQGISAIESGKPASLEEFGKSLLSGAMLEAVMGTVHEMMGHGATPPAGPSMESRWRDPVRVQFQDENGNIVRGEARAPSELQGRIQVKGDDGHTYQVHPDQLNIDQPAPVDTPPLPPRRPVAAAADDLQAQPLDNTVAGLKAVDFLANRQQDRPAPQMDAKALVDAMGDVKQAQETRQANAQGPEQVPHVVRTENELRYMSNPKLKVEASRWGVTYDTRATTIPRILDAMDEWHQQVQTQQERADLDKMTDKELYWAVRDLPIPGTKASGDREKNIQTMLQARRMAGELPSGTADARNPSPLPPAQPPMASATDAERPVEAPRSDGAETPRTFTTAKGSTYQVHEDGTTTRTKSDHSDVGHDKGDVGQKQRSDKTLYVENGMAGALSSAGMDASAKSRVIVKDGKASLLTWNEREGKWGRAPSGTDIPVSTEPGIGKQPLELWDAKNDIPGHESYGRMHAGNEIVSMGEAAPQPTITKTKGIPDYIREEMTRQGKNPDRLLNDIDASRPKTQQQLANDPVTRWLEQNDPAMAERMKAGDLSATEYQDAKRRMLASRQQDAVQSPPVTQPEGAGRTSPPEGTPNAAAKEPPNQFDAKEWDAREQNIADAVKASRQSGAKHLDQIPPYVETMRGMRVRSIRDGSSGTVTTVGTDGVIHVLWDDAESAKSNGNNQDAPYNGLIFPHDAHEFVAGEKIPNYKGMSLTDLRAAARGRGLDPKGTKVDLVKRMEESHHENPAVIKNFKLQGEQPSTPRKEQPREQEEAQGRQTPSEVLSKPEASAQRDTAPEAPAATPRDYGTVDAPNRSAMGEHFAEQLSKGKSYPTISEARREAGELLKGEVKPGTQAAKAVDEAVEIGVVRAAHDIVRGGGSPREVFDKLVDLYNRQPNLNVRTSTSIEQQAYSTPAPLAYLAQKMAGVEKGTRVYEPTAGNGMLVAGVDKNRVIANELNPDRADALRQMGYKVTQRDAAEPLPRDTQFESVIANPPFGAARDESGRKSWEIDGVKTNELDHAIVLQSLKGLPQDGTATLILGAKGADAKTPLEKRQGYVNKNYAFYKHLYDNYNVVDHFTVDGDLYSRQGAKFPVDVIVIHGRGKSVRPYPWQQDGVVEEYHDWNTLADHALAVSERAPSRVGPIRADRSESAGAGDSAASGRHQGPVPGRVSDEAGGSGAVDDRAGGRPRRDIQGSDRADGGRESRPARGEPVRNEDAAAGRPARPDVGRPAGAGGGAESGDVPHPADAGGSVRGGPDDSGNGPERVAEPAAPRRARVEQPKEQTTEYQADYTPASNIKSVGTLVPRNMATPISEALADVQANRGDLVKFVADSTGFDKGHVENHFSAEQVDALALAIHAHQEGKGFIIGDQTGVGKGRVVAGMIRYAQRNGLAPVFITQQPALYGDMVRDLTDIGVSTSDKPFDPLPTNKLTAEDKIPLPDGRILSTKPGPQERTVNEAIDNFLRAGKLEADGKEYGALFTTYSQLQSVAGESTWRNAALKRLIKNAFIVLDESHEAGGTKKTGRKAKDEASHSRSDFVRALVKDAAGVMYSSATYAKRPDVMDLYSRTDMALAVDGDVSKLAAAIEQGGVPLQQVTANMLAQVGQYIRRERTFHGVKFAPEIVPVDLDLADHLSEAFRAVRDFDKAKSDGVDAVKDAMVGEGGGMGSDTSTGKAGVTSTNFSSILWNVVDQMLLALKADAVVKSAVESAKAGKRPVVVVDNTMEAVLDRFVQQEGIKKGDPVPHTFKDMVRRYLERSREVIVKDAGGEHSRHYLTDGELGPEGLAAYNHAAAIIDKLNVDNIPISPIDYILKKLKDAGLNFAEVTGRNQTLDYQDSGPPLLGERNKQETGIQGKVKSVKAFNDGTVDGIVLNRSASTGLSLHSSPKFKDMRQRHMIIAQAAKNIDTFMQMLGRVHRTGQVVPPEYTLLMSDAPAENRPAAVLVKKLASLNASVTASSKGAVGFDVPDLINEVGDQVIGEHLQDNPETARMLDLEGRTPNEDGKYEQDLSAKATGRAALMPVKDQQRFWSEMVDAFEHRIKELNAMNDNPLVAQTMDLDARPVKELPVFEGTPGSDSPFAGPAVLNEMDVKRQGKPYTSEQVREQVRERVGGELTQSALEKWKEKTGNGLRGEFNKYVNSFDDQAEGTAGRRVDAQRQLGQIERLIEEFHPGTGVKVVAPNGDEFTGYVTDLFRRGKPRNPAANSAWNLKVAVTDALREITIPVSRIAKKGYSIEHSSTPLADFDSAQSRSRETRHIATGNLLAAFAKLEDGRIINYTDHEGKTRQGILMPKKFTPREMLEKGAEVFEKPEDAIRFLQRSSAHKLETTSDQDLKLSWAGGRLVMEAPKSKARGAKYTLNKPLLNAAGSEFVSSGTKMRMFVDEDRAPKVLKALMKQFQIGAFENKDTAREIQGKKSIDDQLDQMSRAPGVDKLSQDTARYGPNPMQGGKGYMPAEISDVGVDGKVLGAEEQKVASDLKSGPRQWLSSTYNRLIDSANRYSGKMFPTLARVGEESADAAAHYVSSKAYATQAPPVVAQEVVGTVPRGRLMKPKINADLDKLAGAVLVEDNLRSIAQNAHDQLYAMADKRDELVAAGASKQQIDDIDARMAQLREQAERVHTIIGAKGSPLQSARDFTQALQDPAVKGVIERYKDWFAGEADPNFRAAQGISEDADLPSRGEETGARVNLKAILPDDPRTNTTVITSPTGNLRNPLQRNSPFARKAKGTAPAYDISLSAMIENTMKKGTEIANQRRFYDALVRDKIAVIGKPGDNPILNGKRTFPIDIKQMTVVGDRGAVPINRTLWVRSDAYPEVRQALNVDSKAYSQTLEGLASAANQVALVSASEATAHIANQLSAIVRTPGVSFTNVFKRGFEVATGDLAARKQLVDLARIGALPAEPEITSATQKYNPLKFTSKLIKFTDRVARLVIDDAFQKMAGKGLAENTEANRRDLVNQLGQYNKRAQHKLIELARNLGLGPFATAGTAFYSLGLKNLALSPGMNATSWTAGMKMRAMVLSRFAAALGGVALANYLRWGRADGGNNVPVGAVRLADDKDGKTRYFDVASLLNITRGLRAVGLKSGINGIRTGATTGEKIDQGVSDAAQSFLSPFEGPLVNTATTALSGHDAHGFQKAEKAERGQSQAAQNLKAAAKGVNPVVEAIANARDPGAQLGKFGVKTAPRPDESPAEMRARKLLAQQMQGIQLTPGEKQLHQSRRDLIDAMHKEPDPDKKSDLLRKAVESGAVPAHEANDVARESTLTFLQHAIRHLDVDAAMQVWDQPMTPAQRDSIRTMIAEKIARERTRLTPEQKTALLSKLGISPGKSPAPAGSAY